jgi:hypothetical protein
MTPKADGIIYYESETTGLMMSEKFTLSFNEYGRNYVRKFNILFLFIFYPLLKIKIKETCDLTTKLPHKILRNIFN